MSQSTEIQFKPVYDGSRVSKRRYRRNEAWEDHKDFILELVRKKTRQERILRALLEERGFDTKLNQLKRQLGIWGLSKKNLKAKQRKWVYLTNQKRDLEGKDTRFYFGDTGLEVGDTQIEKILGASEADFPDDLVASPGELEISTPPTDDTSPEGDMSVGDEVETTVEQPEPGSKAPTPIDPDLGIIETSPSPITAQADESDTSAAQPEAEVPVAENATRFEEIYREILQTLDSLQLAANDNMEREAGEVVPLSDTGWRWPGPDTNEYATDLQEWMEEEFDAAKFYTELVQELVANQGWTFKYAAAYASIAWIEDYNEEPAPYHICWAIANGQVIPPVVNENRYTVPGNEPGYIGCYFPDSPGDVVFTRPPLEERQLSATLVQKQAWIPAVDPQFPILTESEWDQIDSLHNKYYANLRKRCNRLAKSNPGDGIIYDFRCTAAHLQFLRYTFGELSFFTVSSLAEFASIMQKIGRNDAAAMFLLEKALKLSRVVGLTYHSSMKDLYISLSELYRDLGNHHTTREYLQIAYMISESVFGPEGMSAIHDIPYIALCDFRTGFPIHGDFVLAKGLGTIQSIISKIPKDTHKKRLYLAMTLFEIASVYRRTKRRAVAQKVLNVALQELKIFQETYAGHNPEKGGLVPRYMGEVYSRLKDYDNAMVMFQRAYTYYAANYGEKDEPSVYMMRQMCKAMRRRGLALYTIPIFERWWRIQAGPEVDEENDGTIFELWTDYMKVTFKLEGYGAELRELRRQLEY